MRKGSPSCLCLTVPKNSKQKVPNGCLKSAPNQIESSEQKPRDFLEGLSAVSKESYLLSLFCTCGSFDEQRPGRPVVEVGNKVCCIWSHAASEMEVFSCLYFNNELYPTFFNEDANWGFCHFVQRETSPSEAPSQFGQDLSFAW